VEGSIENPRLAGAETGSEVNYAVGPKHHASRQRGKPIINVLASSVLCKTITLLQPAFEFLALAINGGQVIICEFSLLLFDLALHLFPIPLNLVPVHVLPPD